MGENPINGIGQMIAVEKIFPAIVLAIGAMFMLVLIIVGIIKGKFMLYLPLAIAPFVFAVVMLTIIPMFATVGVIPAALTFILCTVIFLGFVESNSSR